MSDQIQPPVPPEDPPLPPEQKPKKPRKPRAKKQKAVVKQRSWFARLLSSIKPTPARIQKVIDLSTKIFTGIITAPATWLLAETHLAYIPAEYRIFVQIASIGVVEGLFFGSLWKLETNKELADSEKITNSIVLWIAYGLVVLVGFEQEGATALIFRLAIALYLFRVTQASIAYGIRKRRERAVGEQRSKLVRLVGWFLHQQVTLRNMRAEANVRKAIILAHETARVKAIQQKQEAFNNAALLEIERSAEVLMLPLPAAETTTAAKSNQHTSTPAPTKTGPTKQTKSGRQPTVTARRISQTADQKYGIEVIDGEVVGRCPICQKEHTGITRRSVIGQINGHMKSHPKILPMTAGIGRQEAVN
jgi:hypothetical protein